VRRSQPAEDRPPTPAPLLLTPPRPRGDGQRRDSSSHAHEEILRVAHPAAQLNFTGVPSEADPQRQRLAAHPEQHSLRHRCPVADATPDRDTGPNAPVASPLRPVTGYPGAGSPDEVPTSAIRLNGLNAYHCVFSELRRQRCSSGACPARAADCRHVRKAQFGRSIAALAALRLGEVICVPGLNDPAMIDTISQARQALALTAAGSPLSSRYQTT